MAYLRRAAAAALALLSPLAALAATVETLPLEGGRLELVFTQPGAAGATVERYERELVLRFPRRLPDDAEGGLQKLPEGWVESVSVGYDSLVLRLSRRVAVEAAPDGARLRILLRRTAEPAAPETAPPEVAAPSAARRLALVEARALALSGESAEARRRIAALRASDPGDPDPVMLLAGIELTAGRWRLSAEQYREALRLNPRDEDSKAALAAIGREQGSRLRLDFDYREIQNAERVYTTRLGGVWARDESWRAGGTVETAYITTHQVQRTNGQSLPFEGVRARGEAYLQFDARNGDMLRGLVYGGMQAGGIGADWQRPDDAGVTMLHGELAHPNWDFIDGMVNGARRDRVSVARTLNLGTFASARVEGGGNRYDIPGHGDVGNSVTATAELRFTPLFLVRNLAAVYTLDGEYPFDVQFQTDAAGNRFRTLSLVKREVHTLTATYGAELLTAPAEERSLLLEGFGGWGLDRFGRPGPLYGLTLSWTEGPLDLQLRASQVRHIGRGGESGTLVGGTFAWHF